MPALTLRKVGTWLVERRLTGVSGRLRALREELRVMDEQLMQLADEADDSRIRSLVSETALADHEYREASRHADTMRAHRQEVVENIARLERRQDELLDQLSH
jgi:chromosome segregation ATPase